MSEFFVELETIPDAELFGHMIRLGLALTAGPDGYIPPGTDVSDRERAIRMYDECAHELNRRNEQRRKAGSAGEE